MVLYHWDEEGSTWNALSTALDEENHTASGQTYLLGDFDLRAPLLCPEGGDEPNETFYEASALLAPGVVTTGPFDIAEDQDWYKLAALAGDMYLLQTSHLAPGADTVLELYTVDGLTLLAQDDDDDGLASYLAWRAPSDVMFCVRVLPDTASARGCDVIY
jgi:hypothetical protein